MGRACGTYGKRIEVCTGCWWGSLRERGHWGRPRCRWEDNIKMDLREVGGGGRVVGTGWSWLRIGTGGGHLWVR
jgi:hypothetical protein